MLKTAPDQFLQMFNMNDLHQRIGMFSYIKSKFPILKRARIVAANKFIERLDQIEQLPILFSKNSSSIPQKLAFNIYLDIGRSLLNFLKDCPTDEAAKISHKLKRRLIALKYRLESANDGYDAAPVIQPQMLEKLQACAIDWKSKQHCFFNKSLTQNDTERLTLACHYPELINIALDDPRLQHALFCWILRDKINVRPFIEYPALQERISECGLNGRIGIRGGEQLKIQKLPIDEYAAEKIVTLSFEGRDCNILDEGSTVTFQGNYTLTISEIFNVFRRKSEFVMGNLEYFCDGIRNWNVNRLGWWDHDKEVFVQVNLDQDEWWKNLPVFEIISLELAQLRYGDHMNGKNWNVASVASRSNQRLDVYGNHAYLEIAIPSSDGRYCIYDFGKAAEQFPWDPIQKVTRSCENFEAVICYPDENVFYTHRQHVCHSFPLTQGEGLKIMAAIKSDLLKVRAGNMVYQIQSENCAEWVQLLLESQLGKYRVPNLFRIPYLSTEPTGIMGKVFLFIKALPHTLQKDLLMLFHIPFGAKRGRWIIDRGQKIWKSMYNHAIWHHAEVYLPAFLHKQIECQSLEYISPQAAKDLNQAIVLRGNMLRTVAPSSEIVIGRVKSQVSYAYVFQKMRAKFAYLVKIVDPNVPLPSQAIPRGGGGPFKQLVLHKLRL